MEGPLPGRTALLITVSPVPGKYDFTMFSTAFVCQRIFFVVGHFVLAVWCNFSLKTNLIIGFSSMSIFEGFLEF